MLKAHSNYNELIRQYFKMWLTKDIKALDSIFDPKVHYIECYGPEYVGITEVKRWMQHMFQVQTVVAWNIKKIYSEQNVYTVEWFFSCVEDGHSAEFDGVSIIKFEQKRIREIKEFQSKPNHYRPYRA